jgi:glycosyltransferase involved in cell wall biosynthesis
MVRRCDEVPLAAWAPTCSAAFSRVPTRLSIALVVRNRADNLERALRSIRAQTVQPWEIVVSDDSSADHAPAIAALAESFSCRYVRGPQRGLYANRNAAAVACSGTHVRTMDDDHEFPPGHLAACGDALAEDADAVWAIGEWVPAHGPLPQPVPSPGEIHPRGFTVAPRDTGRSAAIADGSTIYPREIFDRGIRYADEFVFGVVYLELGERLAHLGYRIRHLESTYVVHHADPKRSIEAPAVEEAARMYAMLCHSFLYRPSGRDRALTTLELIRRLVRGRRQSARSLRVALASYRRRRAELGRRGPTVRR